MIALDIFIMKFKETSCKVFKIRPFLVHTKYFSKWISPVIEEELLSSLDRSLREDADSVVAVDHHHFGIAVRVDRMVRETNLVAFSSGIHDKVYNI